MEIQSAYAGTFHGAAVVPLSVYSHPGYDSARNIFCAVEDSGSISGYASLFSVIQSGIFWAEIKVNPRHRDRELTRSLLLEVLLSRAGESSEGHAGRVCLQYSRSEVPAIAFAEKNSFRASGSMFTLSRDLSSHPPAGFQLPDGITMHHTVMPGEAERRAYLGLRNASIPYASWSLTDLAHLLASPLFERGTTVCCMHGNSLIGSAMAYWDVSELKRQDSTGYTEQVFVDSAYRGRGVATCLLEAACAFLRGHGVRHARLDVMAENRSALSLYEKLGYRAVAELIVYERRV
jgi:ribosomal protein S18 acetylase RimI-like enzyme